MKLLSWMHRKFQGTRVNPCKEPPAIITEESCKDGEKVVAPAAHYFLIRRKDSGEPWIPLKIATVDSQQPIAAEKDKLNNLQATPPNAKKPKLPFSVSNCFHQDIVDEGPAALSSLVEDQLGLLAIGTFGLREFADGELGDLEGFEMFVGTSESALRSKLNIPEPANESSYSSDNCEKQVLEIGKGVYAQGFRRDSPVFGENPVGELQVFGGYCWELRGDTTRAFGEAKEDETSSDLKIAAAEVEPKSDTPEENRLEAIEEGKDMLSVQKYLESYNTGVPPCLKKSGREEKLLQRLARLLGSRTSRRGQLPAPESAPECRPVQSVDTEGEDGKGKQDFTKVTNSTGLAHQLFKLRSKSSTWIKPLTRLREQTSRATKKLLGQGSSGERKVVSNSVAFTCGPHHPRRKRSGRPQLRDLFDEPTDKDVVSIPTQDAESGTAQCSSDPGKTVEQSAQNISASESVLTIDWASDGDEEFVSQSSDSEEQFELNEAQWLKSDSEYFVLEL